MALGWRRRESAGEPSGPYQFFATPRRCPACKEFLLTQEMVLFGPASGIIRRVGVPCYCMACNGHYRAFPRPWMRWVPWGLGAMGLNRWLWWCLVRIKRIYTYQEGFF